MRCRDGFALVVWATVAGAVLLRTHDELAPSLEQWCNSTLSVQARRREALAGLFSRVQNHTAVELDATYFSLPSLSIESKAQDASLALEDAEAEERALTSVATALRGSAALAQLAKAAKQHRLQVQATQVMSTLGVFEAPRPTPDAVQRRTAYLVAERTRGMLHEALRSEAHYLMDLVQVCGLEQLAQWHPWHPTTIEAIDAPSADTSPATIGPGPSVADIEASFDSPSEQSPQVASPKPVLLQNEIDVSASMTARDMEKLFPSQISASLVQVAARRSSDEIEAEISVADAVLQSFATELHSVPLQRLARARLPRPKLEALYARLTAAQRPTEAERACAFFEAHARDAAPVQAALQRAQAAAWAAAEATAERTAAQSEADARTELKDAAEGDVETLRSLLATRLPASEPEGPTASETAGLFEPTDLVELGARAELAVTLHGVSDRRSAELASRQAGCDRATRDLALKSSAALAREREATEAQAAAAAIWQQLQSTATACQKQLAVSHRQRQASHMQARAVEIALGFAS